MQQSARRAQPWRATHCESSCSPSCGASERCSSAAKLAAAPPSRDRQRLAMSMSTDGHTSTSASATPAKLAAMLMPSSLHHGGRPAGGLGAADGQRVGARSRDRAQCTRNRSAQTAQRIDQAGSDHCSRELVPENWLRDGVCSVGVPTLYTKYPCPYRVRDSYGIVTIQLAQSTVACRLIIDQSSNKLASDTAYGGRVRVRGCVGVDSWTGWTAVWCMCGSCVVCVCGACRACVWRVV